MLVESEVEIAGLFHRIAGETNTIDCRAVFWIEIAVVLKAEVVFAPVAERLERDDGVFAAADRDEVAAKYVVEVELFLFGWRWRIDGHEGFVWNLETIDEHEFAEAVEEEFLEECLLVVVKLAALNCEGWREAELVVVDGVDNTEIKAERIEELLIDELVSDAWKRDLEEWFETMLAKRIDV